MNSLLSQVAYKIKANFGTALQPDAAVVPLAATASSDPFTQIEVIISNVIGALTVVAGLFFVIYFIMAGVNWVTAGGDSGKIQKARDQMIQGAIGLVVIVMAYGLVGLISNLVGIHLLTPGQLLKDLQP